jgi:hypothetical protein
MTSRIYSEISKEAGNIVETIEVASRRLRDLSNQIEVEGMLLDDISYHLGNNHSVKNDKVDKYNAIAIERLNNVSKALGKTMNQIFEYGDSIHWITRMKVAEIET